MSMAQGTQQFNVEAQFRKNAPNNIVTLCVDQKQTTNKTNKQQIT